MFTPEGIKKKDAEDLEDFCIADANKDGRLSWEEYKVQQKRIYDKDVERFGGYIKYNDKQLDTRY